jgi:hypothetical protein
MEHSSTKQQEQNTIANMDLAHSVTIEGCALNRLSQLLQSGKPKVPSDKIGRLHISHPQLPI